ncbi:MAG: hypothetical protein F4060_00005, partial [Holophagales bacterium]|nr:hypothetical protein [Holophagales bacterium]MYI78302.1 hypothetical protein [Holophagales bacterium]
MSTRCVRLRTVGAFRVAAFAPLAFVVLTPEAQAQSQAPSVPTNVQATAASPTSIRVTWDASTSGSVDNYNFQGKRSTNQFWQGNTFSTAGNVSEYTLDRVSFTTPLAPGTAYDVRVRACRSQGMHPEPSIESCSGWVTVENVATFAFAAPTLSAMPVTATSVRLTWTAPSGSPTGYRYEWKASTTASWTGASGMDAGGSATGADVDSLDQHTPYDFRVRAMSSAGNGVWSNVRTVAGRPQSPGNFAATASTTEAAIELSWAAPTSNGGKELTGYEVQWRPDANGDWNQHGNTGSKTVAGTATSGRVTIADGLQHAATYNFRISAANADRRSFWTPGDGSVEATTQGPAPPTDFSAGAPSKTSVTVSWRAGSQDSNRFVLQIREGSTGSWSNVDQSGRSEIAGAYLLNVFGLHPGREYQFRARACRTADDGTCGAWTATVSETTKPPAFPAAPGNFQATPGERRTGLSDTQVYLDWDHVTATGDATLTGYRYEWKRSDASTWTGTDIGLDPPDSHATVGSLDRSRGHDFRVRARGTLADGRPGDGAWTAITTVAGRPATPTGLTTSDVQAHRVTLSWNAVTGANTGGKPISNYRYEWRKFVQGQAIGDGWTALGTTDTSVTIPDLTLNTSYEFRMRAENADRVGFFTSVVSATTLNQVSVSIAAASANEGEPLTFTVSLSAAWTENVTVNWATSDVGAVAGSDYTAASGSVMIPTSDTSATVTVDTLEDVLDESDERFMVTLTAPPGGLPTNVTFSDAAATGTIMDDDDPPTLSVDSPRVTEGDSGTTATMTFTYTLSAASGREVEVTASLGGPGETATSGDDYATALPGASLSFASGETSKTVEVTVNGDNVAEGDETVRLGHDAPTNAAFASDVEVIGGTAVATGTIVDDDTAPATIDLSVDPSSIGEADGATAVNVTAAFPVGSDTISMATDVTVEVGAAGDSATEGTDYQAVSTVTVTIPAAMPSGTGTFTLTPINDTAGEGHETITVSGTPPAGFTAVNAATLTVLDDDAPVVSVADAEGTEGGTVTFTVSISQTIAQDVTVNWATSDAQDGHRATADSDYTAVTGGSVTIPANQRSATFEVETLQDILDEYEEAFRVTLSEPPGGLPQTAQGRVLLAADPSATGTIADDDPPPVLWAGMLGIEAEPSTEGDSGTRS